MGVAAVGVKPMVIDTGVLPAIRSEDAMVNEGDVTKETDPPTMWPESTAVDTRVSVDVCTVTAMAPAVTTPMLKPDIVTVNEEAGIATPAVVMTIEVAEVALQVPVRPTTLLLPAATVGVMDGAKKPEG
jgi:hypothetical protein